VNQRPWEVAHCAQIPKLGPRRTAVRQHFDIRAFGANVYTADSGERVIDDHDETVEGHEELYLVLSGHAVFTVADEEVDAPPGTFVFVRDPAVQRTAVARKDGTAIFIAGGRAGEPFEPSGWELGSAAHPFYERGDYEGAIEALRPVVEQHPDNAVAVYNLACYEALAGRRDGALEHLRRAAELREDLRRLAQEDSDFDPIGDDPEFLAITGQADRAGAGP
jgi:tetratricopeptide (TPR) repeat protein